MADPSSITSEQLAAVSAAPLPFVGALLAAWAITTAVTWLLVNHSKKDQVDTLNERIKHRDEEIERLKARASDAKDEASEREDRIKAAEAEVKSYDERFDTLVNEAIARDSQLLDLTAELQKARADLEAANSKSIEVEFVEPAGNSYATAIAIFGDERSKAKKPAAARRTLAEMQQALEPRRLDDEQKAAIKLSLNGLEGRIDIITASNADEPEGLRDDLRDAFGAAGWRVETLTSMSRDPSRAGLELVVGNLHELTDMETRVHEALFAADLPHDLIRAMTSVEAEIRIVKRAK